MSAIPLELLRQVIAPLILDRPDHDHECVGTCFIVGVVDEYAIGITATHSLMFAESFDVPSRAAPHPTAVVFAKSERREWNQVSLTMGIRHDDVPPFMSLPMTVKEAWCCPSLDVAFVLLKPDYPVNMKTAIALYSKGPEVGETVYVAGFFDTRSHASHKIGEGGKAVFAAVHGQYKCVTAIVSKLYEAGVRDKRWPCFKIDTPLESGMSGGCVLREYDGQLVACGMITSDLSLMDGKASGEEAIAACLFPALVTPLPEREFFVRSTSADQSVIVARSILDLIDAGIIKDYSEAPEHVVTMPDRWGNMTVSWRERGK